MQKIINKKDEDSLRNISQKLQESLLKELNENFKEKNKKIMNLMILMLMIWLLI